MQPRSKKRTMMIAADEEDTTKKKQCQEEKSITPPSSVGELLYSPITQEIPTTPFSPPCSSMIHAINQDESIDFDEEKNEKEESTTIITPEESKRVGYEDQTVPDAIMYYDFTTMEKVKRHTMMSDIVQLIYDIADVFGIPKNTISCTKRGYDNDHELFCAYKDQFLIFLTEHIDILAVYYARLVDMCVWYDIDTEKDTIHFQVFVAESMCYFLDMVMESDSFIDCYKEIIRLVAYRAPYNKEIKELPEYPQMIFLEKIIYKLHNIGVVPFATSEKIYRMNQEQIGTKPLTIGEYNQPTYMKRKGKQVPLIVQTYWTLNQLDTWNSLMSDCLAHAEKCIAAAIQTYHRLPQKIRQVQQKEHQKQLSRQNIAASFFGHMFAFKEMSKKGCIKLLDTTFGCKRIEWFIHKTNALPVGNITQHGFDDIHWFLSPIQVNFFELICWLCLGAIQKDYTQENRKTYKLPRQMVAWKTSAILLDLLQVFPVLF